MANTGNHRPKGQSVAKACVIATTIMAGCVSGAFAQEGSFAIATLNEPPTAESHNAYNANSRTVLGNIYESLVGRDGETNEFVPELATSWAQVDDRTWDFDLRDGVVFHDGSALNAQGVADALTWVWAEDNAHQIRVIGGPELTFTAVDDDTLRVEAADADPLLLTRMWQMYVPSAEQIANRSDTLASEAVGTGPYMQSDWNKGNSFTMTANPNWWGLAADDAYGGQHYQEITFLFRPEPAGRIAALQAGEVQLAERLPGELCQAQLGEGCVSSPDTTSTYLRLDAANPVLADPRVREAMSLAIDRETIGQALMGGASPAKMIIGPSATGYNAALPELDYDMERAKALIEEAKADGVPIGETPLHIKTMTGGFIGNTDVMQVLMEQFKQIGLEDIDAEAREISSWRELFVGVPQPIDPGRGLIAMHKHTNDPYDFAGTVANFYTCEGRLSTSCNPELDEKQAAARSLVGAERQQAYEEIARIAYEDMWYIPLHHEVRFHGLSSDYAWTPPLHAGIRVAEIAPK